MLLAGRRCVCFWGVAVGDAEWRAGLEQTNSCTGHDGSRPTAEHAHSASYVSARAQHVRLDSRYVADPRLCMPPMPSILFFFGIYHALDMSRPTFSRCTHARCVTQGPHCVCSLGQRCLSFDPEDRPTFQELQRDITALRSRAGSVASDDRVSLGPRAFSCPH